MSNKPIVYLINKYSGCEEQSVEESMNAVSQLLKIGVYPLSPILHTHFFEQWRKKQIDVDKSWEHECGYTGFDGNNPCYPEVPDSYDCDPDCPKKKVLKYKEPDYYDWDLTLLEGFLKHDAHGPLIHELKTIIESYYDSGIVAVVLPSAYHYECSVCKHEFNTFDSYGVDPHAFICGDEASTCDLIWDSKGAKKEYEFCTQHHILCITLETALTIEQKDWHHYAL